MCSAISPTFSSMAPKGVISTTIFALTNQSPRRKDTSPATMGSSGVPLRIGYGAVVGPVPE